MRLLLFVILLCTQTFSFSDSIPTTTIFIPGMNDTNCSIPFDRDLKKDSTNIDSTFRHKVIIDNDVELYLTYTYCSDTEFVDFKGDTFAGSIYEGGVVCSQLDKDFLLSLQSTYTMFNNVHFIPSIDSLLDLAVNIQDDNSVKFKNIKLLGDTLSLYIPLYRDCFGTKKGNPKHTFSSSLTHQLPDRDPIIFIESSERLYKVQASLVSELELQIFADTLKAGHFPPYPMNIASTLPQTVIELDENQDTLIAVDVNGRIRGAQPFTHSIIINEDTLLIADVEDYYGLFFPGGTAKSAFCISSLDTQLVTTTSNDTDWSSTNSQSHSWESHITFEYDTLMNYYRPVSFATPLVEYGASLHEYVGGMGGEYYTKYWFGDADKTVWYTKTSKQVIKYQLDSVACNYSTIDSLYFRIASLPSDDLFIKSKHLIKCFSRPYIKSNFLIIPSNVSADEVRIFNVSGKVIFSKSGKDIGKLNLGGLAKGLYVCNILRKGKTVTYSRIIR